jgi:mono/diheme cytochrome c family protein
MIQRLESRGKVMRRSLVVAVALLLLGACKKEMEPPDREARVSDAGTRFAGMRFDTLTWSSEDQRVREGNAVFAAKCRSCHGTLGEGDTDYAAGRGLAVPSLVGPDWALGDSLDGVRRRVFIGHAAGMPTWGVAGISPREIDAVSFYIVEDLRPEVLGSGS